MLTRSGIKLSWLIWHLFGIYIILHYLHFILLLHINTLDIYSAYVLVSLWSVWTKYFKCPATTGTWQKMYNHSEHISQQCKNSESLFNLIFPSKFTTYGAISLRKDRHLKCRCVFQIRILDFALQWHPIPCQWSKSGLCLIFSIDYKRSGNYLYHKHKGYNEETRLSSWTWFFLLLTVRQIFLSTLGHLHFSASRCWKHCKILSDEMCYCTQSLKPCLKFL